MGNFFFTIVYYIHTFRIGKKHTSFIKFRVYLCYGAEYLTNKINYYV